METLVTETVCPRWNFKYCMEIMERGGVLLQYNAVCVARTPF